MARLPISGDDGGSWGTLLNEFLSVEHNADGTHDPSAFLDYLITTLIFRAEVYATADLPVADSTFNGMIAIEQVTSDTIKLVMYVGDKRYKTASFNEG